MTRPELLRWQHGGNPHYRALRANLLLHILAVPLLWVGQVGLVWAVWSGAWWRALQATNGPR